jgi:hypothetical protein
MELKKMQTDDIGRWNQGSKKVETQPMDKDKPR